MGTHRLAAGWNDICDTFSFLIYLLNLLPGKFSVKSLSHFKPQSLGLGSPFSPCIISALITSGNA